MFAGFGALLAFSVANGQRNQGGQSIEIQKFILKRDAWRKIAELNDRYEYSIPNSLYEIKSALDELDMVMPGYSDNCRYNIDRYNSNTSGVDFGVIRISLYELKIKLQNDLSL
ncbi:hypothetical protein AA0229_1465 [Gluconobacter cerinus NRIC 0229]|uniref:Uncharacterized protein n=2 Tax=Gluconobacter cerinus TaxID=38307 RepID=A0AAV5NH59_9PROT|nr:hypothetical protein AA0229_1465 [Gluconobacter cerinus NRIC 0229]GLQ63698.1 hypothetical protein GCM10007867_25430 [Gluconobacter cerinus]